MTERFDYIVKARAEAKIGLGHLRAASEYAGCKNETQSFDKWVEFDNKINELEEFIFDKSLIA